MMRRYRQMKCMAEVGDLPDRGEAAAARRVGLEIVDRARQNELLEGVELVEQFAQRDRRVDPFGEGLVARDVLVPERFLEPGDVIIGEARGVLLGGGDVPLAVDVDHQLRRVADRLTHRRDAVEVLLRVGLADLHLDRGKAVVEDHRLAVVDEFVLRAHQPSAIGVVGRDLGTRAAAHQHPQRLFGILRLQVPERDVDGGERHLQQPAAPDPDVGRAFAELVVEVADLAWVLADQHRAEHVGDDCGDQAIGGEVGVGAGVAVALEPGVGLDDHPGHAPVGDGVGGIADQALAHRNVEDERRQRGDFHLGTSCGERVSDPTARHRRTLSIARQFPPYSSR